MPHYRATFRFAAGGRHRYHLEDVEAPTLVDALRLAAERLPAEVRGSADLAEIRVQVNPEEREFTPG